MNNGERVAGPATETPNNGLILRDMRQMNCANFVRRVWGDACQADPKERAARVLEEAIELAQANGLWPSDIARTIEHVYSKPAGDPQQEVGGVGVTLLCYCECMGWSADALEAKELRRVLDKKIDELRTRHKIKADAGIAIRGIEAGS